MDRRYHFLLVRDVKLSILLLTVSDSDEGVVAEPSSCNKPEQVAPAVETCPPAAKPAPPVEVVIPAAVGACCEASSETPSRPRVSQYNFLDLGELLVHRSCHAHIVLLYT